jgi:hypothetical protein
MLAYISQLSKQDRKGLSIGDTKDLKLHIFNFAEQSWRRSNNAREVAGSNPGIISKYCYSISLKIIMLLASFVHYFSLPIERQFKINLELLFWDLQTIYHNKTGVR